MARKSKADEWLTPDGLLRVKGWARDGLTDEQIAHNMGCSYSTFRVWLGHYSALSAALQQGKAPVDLEVENALLKRALGFEYVETTTEIHDMPDGTQRKHIKKTTKMVVPDTAAAFIWLKNRRPDKWRDKPPEAVAESDDGGEADPLTAAITAEIERRTKGGGDDGTE